VLVYANLLIYAVNRTSPQHDRAAAWRTSALNGNRRVGIPWQSTGAFLRISIHPRVSTTPLTSVQVWEAVDPAPASAGATR
jgi:predicted nucleic acid-binding protein